MRVIAGRFKGRPLKAPAGDGTRPTVDRVREAMMSSIASAACGNVEGAVLDAFAGSGALGVEALSRGAASCVFYERDRRARAALLGNVKALGLPRDVADVRSADCLAAIAAGPVRRGDPFSLVLLDPPYALEAERVAQLLESLAAHGDLAPGCVVVYEHLAEGFDAAADFPAELAGQPVEVAADKRYGIVGVTIGVWQGRGFDVPDEKNDS